MDIAEIVDFPGMTEAVEGVRIYHIQVSPAPGANLVANHQHPFGVKVTCKFEITQPAATRIFIRGEGTEKCWFKPSGEKTGTGEAEGQFGMFSEGSVSGITFSIFPPDPMMTIYTLPIDPPYTWEERELNEDEMARIAADKLNQQMAAAEEKAQRKKHVEELNRSPVPPTSLVGPSLVRNSEMVDTTAALASTALVGIYFSAHWCGPCVQFTPKMADIYKTARAAGESFEIIFASSDKDQAAFDEYFLTMPWLAIPFGTPEIEALKDRWSVKCIPTLVIVRSNGHIVTFEGKEFLEKMGVDAIEIWSDA